ncbi:30S ribosomal protein S9, partial [Candidatus Uhrbacteria bacterium]|nr:30S ribosomal protein S9 [Candidatus Uhrbacteria bacterium]
MAEPKTIKPKPVKKAAPTSDTAADAILAIGRRKSAIANVKMVPGKGAIMVNDKEYKTYFPLPLMQKNIELPLVLTNMAGMYDVHSRVKGGGYRGQAEALRLGITRGLLKINPELRKTLRSEGLVTRDPRVKERKKPGLKRARRAPQFSKR